MKIILSFDSFKGCMSAQEACLAAEKGVKAAMPLAETRIMALSDGGEGLVDCVRRLLPTTAVTVTVHGPLMDDVRATYAISADNNTAYMEMAAASGLTLIPEERRDPLSATTFGTGEMMADAIKRGCGKIIMGLGGSATCDAGKGMLEALEREGCLDTNVGVVAACDVTNPLYGSDGSAYVFAPQKGATADVTATLDQRLRQFAEATEKAGVTPHATALLPGAGAAGGLGYALTAYLKAELKPGIEILLDIAGFDTMAADADLVITGEGKSDRQTLMGKVPCGVLNRCRRLGVQVWLLSGCIDDTDGQLAARYDLTQSINEGDTRPLDVLMRRENATRNLEDTLRRCIAGHFRETALPTR